MRKDVKEYYRQHFGNFSQASAAEIEKTKEINLEFAGLHGVLFLAAGWKLVRKSEQVAASIVRARLIDYLNRVNN